MSLHTSIQKEQRMTRAMHCILLGLAFAAASTTLSGCPLSPTLLLTPLNISIADAQTSSSFRIQNGGAGTLTWTCTASAPWLTLRTPGGTAANAVSGSTTRESDIIEVLVNRAVLPVGISTAGITVASNAGTTIINLSVTETRPALLQVSETAIDFGTTTTQNTVVLTNGGQQPLNYTLSVSSNAPWLTATPTQGTLAGLGTTANIAIAVNRTGLAANTYAGTVTVTSNGGTAQINVTMQVPPFAVAPNAINFGTISAARNSTITATNNGFAAVSLAATTTTADGAAWLSVAPATATLPASGNVAFTVTANPAGRAPGNYSGEVRIRDTVTNFTLAVPVTMTITRLEVAPTLLDFGDNPAQTQLNALLTNLDAVPVPFAVSIPAQDQPWLSVTPASGNVTGTQNLQFTINRNAVAPGAYETVASIQYDGGTLPITLRMIRPRPAELRVEPNIIDFGATRNQELIALWNNGLGTINYTIDTATFPAWLTIAPAPAGGVISGTLTGSQTDAYTLSVNRSLVSIPPNTFTYSFNVIASGDASNNITVNVTMTVPLVPQLVLEADGIDDTGTDFLNFDIRDNTKTFFIRNDGNGPLFWQIPTAALPQWITTVSPSSGSLQPGTQQSVTIGVNRGSLTFLGAQITLLVTSNDPRRPATPLIVEVQVPKRVAITTRPTAYAFGTNVNSDLLEIANSGDPDTLLSYRITTTKEWLSVFPETGSSVGTASSFKDFQPHSVSVDRSLLDGVGASGKIIITAFEVRDGQQVPIPDVAPVEIPVTVDAASLTIEAASPRLRIPSLVRFVLLMRNIRYQALPLPDTRLADIGQQFLLFENNLPVERSEANQFLSPISRARGNALIMLDYSGSMRAAAAKVSDTTIALAPDPLQALYASTIPQLIAEIPANYKIGIAVFNDRSGAAIRPIYGTAAEPTRYQDDIFIRDRSAAIARFNSIVVNDNGATELFLATQAAAALLEGADLANNHIPFDDADIRAIIAVTDGRVTTPPGNISDTTKILDDTRARFLAIGWGENVASDILLRLANESGGHVYSTRNAATGAVDAFGNPIRIPVVAALADWCETDPLDECDQSIAKDLASQVLLSYTSLNEESNARVEARVTFNDPNDQNSVCLPEQGDISGSIIKNQVPLDEIAGDVRLGQVAIQTEGIQPDGTAEVLLRTDGMPRNISRLSFRISVLNADPLSRANVTQVLATQGGIIADWIPSGAGDVFTYQSPAGPLQYGDFGYLLRIRITGAASSCTLLFDVLEPSITSNPESKYFTHPDTVTIADDEFLAPAFPTPFFATQPAYTVAGDGSINIDLGTNLNAVDVTLFNLGGHHIPTGVWLDWRITLGLNSPLLVLPPGPAPSGTIILNTESDTVSIGVDRAILPGTYTASFRFVFSYGSLGIEYDSREFFVTYTVLPPDFAVDTNNLSFAPGTIELPLTVRNDGQGIINWAVNAQSFPFWLQTTQTQGALTPGASTQINVRVDRSQLTAGNYNFTMNFSTDVGAVQSVNVLLIVP